MKLFTIGFTKKSAEQFFGLLQDAGVKRVLDVRLHGQSQLAGFAKQSDLPYFLEQIAGIGYEHIDELASPEELLQDFRKKRITWEQYVPRYEAMLAEKRPAQHLDKALFNHGCLLCSENEPDYCHRRLAAEYLARQWGDLEIVHLM